MTRKYDISEQSLEAGAELINEGGILIYPTETCYGIGGDALNEHAIDRVYTAKQRPRDKPLTAIVANLEMAERYCSLDATERALVREFMPGPLTLVAEKNDRVPDALNDQFVFRIPGDEPARQLSLKADTPIIATSANLSGQPARYRVDAIDEAVLHEVDMVLDAGTLEEEPPSTIVEVTHHALRVHREGPVDRDALEQVVNTWQSREESSQTDSRSSSS